MYVGTIHSWCLNALQEYKYECQKFSVLDEIKLSLFIEKNFKQIRMQDVEMERFKDTGRFIALMGILREAEFIMLMTSRKNYLTHWKNTKPP